MAHNIDHYAERQRRQRTPQDRFEIRDGHDVVARMSSLALALARVDELKAQRPDFEGRLTVRDTWSQQ